MKKIPDHLDNPIDNVLISLCETLSPMFKATHHTPNMITTYSLITGLLSCYYLYYGNYILFSVFFALSYFFDCFDGHFARKYNMTSKWGDFYDHTKDVSVFILLLFVLWKRYRDRINAPIIVLFLIFTYLALTQLGCQQKIYGTTKAEGAERDHESLDNLKPLCPSENSISWARFFGTGTYNLIIILLVNYIILRPIISNKAQ